MFFSLILFVITFVLSELLRPKPKNNDPRPAALGDFNFPTATEGRMVPLIWGTIKTGAPNVVWYGDLKRQAITKEQKTGIFSSNTVTTGFMYKVGMQFALARGLGVELRGVWIGKKKVFNGNLNTDGSTFNLNLPNLFGGNELGNGGIKGDFYWYTGSETQNPDSYLVPFQTVGGAQPAYRGTAHGVWRGGYVGNSSQIDPWEFELRRIPQGLGLSPVNSADCNPMEMLYEILTNNDWGLGFLTSDIDTVAMVNVGNALAAEGNGISWILDSTKPIADVINEIQRQIEGVVFLDRTTGKWTVRIARGGYDINTIPQLTSANIIATNNFARGAWQDTSNQVRVEYAARAKDYNTTYSMHQDMANMRIQTVTVPVTQQYPMVKDSRLASQLSWRDLRILSFPLAKVQLVVDRSAYLLNPYDIVAWTDTTLNITKMGMRVQKLDFGDIENGKITLDLVQDVFSFAQPIFGDAIPTGWVLPPDTLVNIPGADRVFFEAPKGIVDRAPILPGRSPRVYVAIRNQGDGAVKYTISEDGANAGQSFRFALAGQLAAALPASTFPTPFSLDGTPDTATDFVDQTQTGVTTADQGQSLTNLLYITDGTNYEFMTVASAAVSGTQVVLTGACRGVMDSNARTWPSGTRVYVLKGDITSFQASGFSTNITPVTASATSSLVGGTATAVSLNGRYSKPYPIARLNLSAAEWPTTTDIASVTASTDPKGITVSFVRKDWRTTDEYASITSEASLPADFPTANTTQYNVDLRNDPAGANTLIQSTGFLNANSFTFDRAKILRQTVGVIPTRMRAVITSRHTVNAVTVTCTDPTIHDFNITDSQLGVASTNLGLLATNVNSSAFVAPVTGTYTFSITSNQLTAGVLQASVNAGAFATVIGTGATSATLALTAGDSVRVKHTQAGSAFQTLLFVDTPGSALDFYAILTLN